VQKFSYKSTCTKEKTMAKVLGKFGLHNRNDEIYGCLVLGFKNMMSCVRIQKHDVSLWCLVLGFKNMMWAFDFVIAVPTTPKILTLSKFWSPLTKLLSSIYTLIRLCVLAVGQVPLCPSKEYKNPELNSTQSHKSQKSRIYLRWKSWPETPYFPNYTMIS